MDVSNLLSYDTQVERDGQPEIDQATQEQDHQRSHQYSTRYAILTNGQPVVGQGPVGFPLGQATRDNGQDISTVSSHSPGSIGPKNVAFELLFEGATNYRARLPMRVQIFPHDTTESIVTTVKNFYGLYEGTAKGVSFEDDQGHTLIARYENLKNNMVVYVRVIPDYPQNSQPNSQAGSHSPSPISAQRTSRIDESLQMLPPQPAQALSYGQPLSRPASRVARKRSQSPRVGRSRRSTSVQKARSRSGIKSHEESAHANPEEPNSDAINGYSSSDGGAGSVTSSRKARSEQLASAEISLDNIVEGGRRKRAKFESSELPLFVPPQVPAPNSVSSISPQRRSNGQENASPFARPTQRNFAYSQPLQSPQSYGFNENPNGNAIPNGSLYTMPLAQHSHRLRERVNTPYINTRSSAGNLPRAPGIGVLPTPDPTIASCISDEDVALQLMRLGDASNISHGRTSASTLDDALSGRADVASSATSESGDDSDNTEQPELPSAISQAKSEASPNQLLGSIKKIHKHLSDGLASLDGMEPSGDKADGEYLYDDKKDGDFKSDPDDPVNEFGHVVKSKMPGPKVVTSGVSKVRTGGPKKVTKSTKPRLAGPTKKSKTAMLSAGFKTPVSPASLAPQSRKNSSASVLNFQHQLADDEEDLSSKPRCQRCRKSKKGCDRQRPCQRCKDAGIGADGCISEDEGNGRKGRFGRHMGVSVKKDDPHSTSVKDIEPAEGLLSNTTASSEKSKKRKR